MIQMCVFFPSACAELGGERPGCCLSFLPSFLFLDFHPSLPLSASRMDLEMERPVLGLNENTVTTLRYVLFISSTLGEFCRFIPKEVIVKTLKMKELIQILILRNRRGGRRERI